MSLTNKIFALTGGCSGIALSTAKLLSQRGATVCLGDIDSSARQAAETYFTSKSVPFMITSLDVSKKDRVEAWLDAIIAKFERLDGAVNAAGIIGKDHGKSTVADQDDDEWDKIIAVNLTGCMYCMRAELKRISPGGSIVNIASIHGTKGMPGYGAYAASKHGMIGLTRVAAKENGEKEIRINAVAPGAIYTPLMQKAWDQSGREAGAPFDEPTAFQRQGKAEEVAGLVAFLLGPDSTFVSGSVYAIDGGWL